MLLIDDKLAFATGNVPEFEANRPYELQFASKPGVPHVVSLVVDLDGATPALSRYKFEAKSAHEIAPTSAVIDVKFVEKGDKSTPMEQRPAIEWSETSVKPAQSAPSVGSADGGAP